MASGIYDSNGIYRNRQSFRLKGYDYSRPGYYFITICIHDKTESLLANIHPNRPTEYVSGFVGVGSKPTPTTNPDIPNPITNPSEYRITESGQIVKSTWHDLVNHIPRIELDEFIVMPNHVHGIVRIIGLKNEWADQGSKPCPLPVTGLITGEIGEYARTMATDAGSVMKPGAKPRRDVETGRDVGTAFVVVGAGLEPAPTTTGPSNAKTKTIALPEIVRQLKTFSARRINAIRKISGKPVWQRNYYEHIIRDEKSLDRIRRYIRENPKKWLIDRNHHVDAEIETLNLIERNSRS